MKEAIVVTGHQRFRYLDAALLRASAYACDHAPVWPDADISADVEPWCAWIRRVWADADVADAITVASPVLAGRVEAVCGGQELDAARLRKMVFSLTRYLVRIRGRATPFGLFAGVTPARFGAGAAIRWAGPHHRRIRADARWLASVVARLESYTALRRRLWVVVNDLAVARGDRMVVPWQPHASDLGNRSTLEVSIRHTRPLQVILRVAYSPVRVEDLVDKLAAEFPAAGPVAADAIAAELLTHGLLVSNLRPPSTTVDGLGHVLAVLREVDGAAVPEVVPLLGELDAIHAYLTGSQLAVSRAVGRGWRTAVERMRVLSDTAVQPLVVDLRLGSAVVVPRQVAAEATAAAGALLRLSAAPTGVAAWREYLGRFVDRYSAGAVVPVTQLVDPTAGLGFPRHYAHPGHTGHSEGWSPRDERLLALAQQATLDGSHEVVLDDEAIDALAGEKGASVSPVPHLDLGVEVRAATAAALAAGDFTLVVTGIGQTAVATSGRFLDLLGGEDRERIVSQYAALPVGVDGALAAQVSFPPRHPRLENVTRVPPVLPLVLALGEHRGGSGDQIDVRDLAVTADHDRMYVISLSRRRVVMPTLTCAAARHAMPPLARLLVELPHATSTPAALFDWGAAACLPFRPRLRYRRSILTSAKWRIPADALPGPAAPRPVWEAAMAALRRRQKMPADVLVGTADRRLRLNLDDRSDLVLLRAHLDEARGPVIATEAPSPADHGWLDGRAHELVIPMASTAPPAPAPAVLARPGSLSLISHEHGLMPGSAVLFAKLYAHPDAFDAILTDHLPALLDGWDAPPLWWFVRYRDPAPHLRLRLRTSEYGRAAALVGAWAAELRRLGLIGDLTLDTYLPEIARYGGGAAMAAAEELFAADSAAAAAQVAARTAMRQVNPYALTAISLTDLVSSLVGSRRAGMDWLVEHPNPAGPAAFRDRALLRQAITLADIDAESPTLPAVPGGTGVVAVWCARRQAATTYASRLGVHEAGVTAASVAASLLHLHHNRAHGVEPDAEARTYRLARSIALAYAAYHRPAPEDVP